MARTFVLPDLGEGLVEAEIRAVLVHEGDIVKEDSPLLEVETDKAQVEIPSPFAGRVEKIHVQPGQTVKVGQPLVSFADGGGAAAPTRADGGPVAATPSTRRLARELGVELQAVRGTGPGGRITDDDVRASAGKPPGVSNPPDVPAAPARAAAPAGPAKPLARVGLEPPPL
ncbi:MAG TPA: biotin/lipoyl-containing protein, partial [Methylomirabilota bacterium]|nr:biotin/lipoyl-containing protein [Methylomirabilota bacterium]